MAMTDTKTTVTERLWIGEVRLTVYVPSELGTAEGKRIEDALATLASQLADIAKAVLPPPCETETHIG